MTGTDTQQTPQTQDPSVQTPPPAGGSKMEEFQTLLRETVSSATDTALKSYFLQRRNAVVIDVAAFAVKGAIVIGVVSASLAIGNAILGAKAPEALPPAP